MQGLSVARAQGEQLTLTCGGEQVVIHVDECKQRSCRLRVVAPPTVKVWRGPPSETPPPGPAPSYYRPAVEELARR